MDQDTKSFRKLSQYKNEQSMKQWLQTGKVKLKRDSNQNIRRKQLLLLSVKEPDSERHYKLTMSQETRQAGVKTNKKVASAVKASLSGGNNTTWTCFTSWHSREELCFVLRLWHHTYLRELTSEPFPMDIIIIGTGWCWCSMSVLFGPGTFLCGVCMSSLWLPLTVQKYAHGVWNSILSIVRMSVTLNSSYCYCCFHVVLQWTSAMSRVWP